MNETGDRLVEDYLERLDKELRDLPRSRRREVVDEIAEHISAGREELDAPTDADILDSRRHRVAADLARLAVALRVRRRRLRQRDLGRRLGRDRRAALALFFGAPVATIVHLARRTRARPAT